MNRLLLIVLLFSTAIYCQTCSARSSVSRCSNGPPNDIACFSITDCVSEGVVTKEMTYRKF